MSKQEKIEEKLVKLRESVLNIALRDGSISEDERMVLNSISFNIDNLIDNLDQAFEDDIITPDEKKELKSLVKRVEDDAESIASYDEYLSKDEASILNRLKYALLDINSNIDKL